MTKLLQVKLDSEITIVSTLLLNSIWSVDLFLCVFGQDKVFMIKTHTRRKKEARAGEKVPEFPTFFFIISQEKHL